MRAKTAEGLKGKKEGSSKRRLRENGDFISLLGKCKHKNKRNLLLDFASKEQIMTIVECVYNVLSGNVPLSAKQIKYLRKHRKPMRMLCDRKNSANTRRKILKQKGGFLGALIPMIAGMVPLVTDLVKTFTG